MKSPAHSWTQQWAIIRRTLIKMRRKPISNLVCVLILPALIVGGVTRLIYHTGENNDRGLTEPLSYVSLVTLFIAAYNVFELANSLVADKATGMKSLMMSMGLSRVNYYCGKSITFLVFTLPFTLLLAIVTKLYLLDSHVSYLTIVSLFTLFTLHLDAAVAASVSLITATNFVFITILLVQGSHIVLELLIWYTGLSTSSSLPVVLFFASASPYLVVDCFFGKYLKDHGAEDQQKQLCSQETHLLLAAQIFWIVYFRLFAYWFEEVCPWQKFTSPRGFLFCIKRDKTAKQEDEDQGHSLELVSSMGSKYFEQRFSSESSTNVGIEAKRLRKTFGGEQVAVNDVSFTIYKGETTLLLGHNGAGKSTLMNMILGLLEPNDGYVEFKNREGDIVPAVGVCPQASILDDDLTVKEHLELFNDIKSNLSGNERARHIAQTIGDVSLAGQESKRPQELSGGMKRKLSLGAAFVGQSDVLILDEPSSGLDPDSRISIWNAIRRYRSERTVLLSTQHMEEADYLGDRIAIMSAGRIICCGSSVFLNKMFGTGYKLRLECRSSKREQILAHIREHYFDAVQPMEDSLDPLTRTNADPFVDYVVELATSDENKDSELELIKLLEDLENNAETLSVRSYGLKSSSIEDVMLNTGKHFTPTNQKVGQTATSKAGHLATIAGIRNSSNVSPFDLLWALIIKHLQVYRAEWFNVSVQKLLVPFIGILFLPAILPQPTDELWQNPRVALIVAHLMYFPARDLGSKFKIVQLNSNATVWLYWLAHALTDLIWLIIPMVRIPIYVSNWDCITPIGYWPMVFMLELALFAFYLASMLFCYCLSFVIKPRFAITSFYFISIASLITFGIAYLIIAILFKSNPYWATKTISNIGIFLLPTDAFVYIFAGLRGKCYVRFKDDCIPIAGPSQVLIGFAGLAVQVVLYSSMLYLIERRTINIEWYCRLKNLFPFFNRSRVNATETGEVDQDVVEETNEAMAAINNVNGPHSLVASRLNKSYIRNKKIIADLSFTVNKSECFGLLGVNGAGKTTTFSMLATDSSPDSGRILGNGHYENSDLHKYRAGFGYDPQATPEMSLSPYQALSLMARLRGVDGSSIAQVVRSVLDLLDMSEHAHKPDGKLSGGTKRKLALGMALIGNPAILLLDEPTAGVDPLARRSVWQLLKSLRAHNASSIVISSHAMEECEAICDRIAIMARGRLRCIGTFLHLRSKFAKGCTLRVQSVTDELIDELQQQLVAAIGASVLTLADKSVNSATFNITDNRVRRSILFCTMREFRQKHPNVSYMFNDSSLEDIFVSLAREQEDVDKRKEQS